MGDPAIELRNFDLLYLSANYVHVKIEVDHFIRNVNFCKYPFHPNPKHRFPAAESPLVTHTSGNLRFGLDGMDTYRSA